jgi:hypothetical protein
MKRNFSKISVAALAGASCLLTGHAAKAALTITATKAASSVAFANGTYDVIIFDLTAMTGADATKGGSGQDAEVYGLQGTFTVTGGSMALIGTAANEGADFILPHAQQNYVAAPGLHSSYVPFGNDISAVVVGASGAGKSAGTATSITDTWYTTPAAKTGPGGGVEPGVDGPKATIASGSSSDPYANNGMLAEILVTPGASVAFAGQYSDYGFQSGAPTTFAYSSVTVSSSTTTGTNKIVSLLATAGGPPIGTAPNGYGTAPLGTLVVQNAGGPGKYFPGYVSLVSSNTPNGATSGYVAVTGFLPGDYPEVYALQVEVGGATPTASQISTIIGDITNSSSGVASVTTVAGSAYASIFAGYQILITDTTVDPYFAFDFSSSGSDTTDPDSALGPVTVTSIAAVPEPATAAGVILGAAGLLLGRRKNRLQAV